MEARRGLADHGADGRWPTAARSSRSSRRGVSFHLAPPVQSEMTAEGLLAPDYELEKQAESVKLAIVHEIDKPESKLIEAVSGGWPMILASLKSLLETGEPLEESRHWPKGKC